MNPRAALTTYSLSRGAPSASLGISPGRYLLMIDTTYYIKCFAHLSSCCLLRSGEDGIRTHVPVRTNGFQDRLVMTASIPLQWISCHALGKYLFGVCKRYFIRFVISCQELFFLSSFCENRSQKLPNCFGLFSRTFEVNRSQKSLMQFLLASFAHIHLSVAVIPRRFRPLYSGFQRLAVCVAHRRQVLF